MPIVTAIDQTIAAATNSIAAIQNNDPDTVDVEAIANTISETLFVSFPQLIVRCRFLNFWTCPTVGI